jgi:tetratricopeptide (TPR) repeat protein
MLRSNRTLLILILLSAALLIGAASIALLPTLVRALPGRYAYYLPEPLQAWRQVEHPEVLPTPLWPPTATPTAPPSPTPTPQAAADLPSNPSPTASPTPAPTAAPSLPASHTLSGMQHEPQGWNNCGPVTLGMALSYWGRTETQWQIAPVLKPDPEDKNVSPEEMVDYARSLGLDAVVRVGGDLEGLKRLLVAGFPVVVETWYVREANDQMGHYRLIIGYDDAAQQFLTHDSLHGPDLPIGYQELDELWRAFNRVYLVVYPPERAGEVSAALGPAWDERAAVEAALQTAQAEALNPPPACVAYADCADGQVFAWFNVGSSLVALGRYEEAAAAFDQARVLGLPWRMLWYQFGPYEAYTAVGRYEEVIALADATLAVASNLEESYYWRGLARLALGDSDGARSDWQTALRYHENWPPALGALARLEE